MLTMLFQHALRDLIDEGELASKAETIQAFAYASPEKNRYIGTAGLESSLQYIWDTLDDLDYYDLTRQSFEFTQRGRTFQTSVEAIIFLCSFFSSPK